jgi:hypothetical protein
VCGGGGGGGTLAPHPANAGPLSAPCPMLVFAPTAHPTPRTPPPPLQTHPTHTQTLTKVLSPTPVPPVNHQEYADAIMYFSNDDLMARAAAIKAATPGFRKGDVPR